MIEDFKKCSNGHFYRGTGPCPYCSNDIKSKGNFNDNPYSNISMIECPNGHFYPVYLDKCPYCIEKMEMKVCSSYHAYPAEKEECPFCGETFVAEHFEHSSQETMWDEDIKILSEDSAKKRILVNGHEYKDFYCISISLSRGYKYSYHIQMEQYNILNRVEIKPEDNIVFGRTPMTGKEFIKICDVLLDNRVVLLLNRLEKKTDLTVQLSFADMYNKMG